MAFKNARNRKKTKYDLLGRKVKLSYGKIGVPYMNYKKSGIKKVDFRF